jgi:predicted negative regulator of RcsB-dependent stress response
MKEKIKNWLKNNWFKISLSIIVLIVMSGAFYWYEWRPSQIKKSCYKEARAAETKINAINDNFIPIRFHLDIKDCYDEAVKNMDDCYANNQDITKAKDCRLKVKAKVYNTCYKECLDKNGL